MADEQQAPLIPVDYKQCQCEITPAHSAFRIGPKPKPERCQNAPKWIAYEVAPGEDGRKGAMAVCDRCLVEMKKQPIWQRVCVGLLPRNAR